MGRRYAHLASSKDHHEVVFLGHTNVLHWNYLLEWFHICWRIQPLLFALEKDLVQLWT